MRSVIFSMALASAASQAAEPAWQPFHWVMGSLNGGPPERLGLVLPVTVDGVACTVQLDTGANGDWSWRQRDAQPAGEHRAEIALAGLRRSIPASAANLAQLKQADCGGAPIAIVGNALFENGTLTLDLGRARYAYAPEALLAGVRDAQPLLYLSWAQGGGHIVVEVRRPGGRVGYAMLDTGAARFGLVATNAEEWRALAAGAARPKAGDPGAITFTGPKGEPVSCGDVQLKDGLAVGGKTLPTVRASYCDGHSFQAPLRLVGGLGMAPLGDRTIVLDYLSRRWTLSD
nr:hypothetical protein [uncultured Duganella sp.]